MHVYCIHVVGCLSMFFNAGSIFLFVYIICSCFYSYCLGLNVLYSYTRVFKVYKIKIYTKVRHDNGF